MEKVLIYASTPSWGIANKEQIPWIGVEKEEMESFKAITKGNVVIMGRKTFETLKRPLAGRVNIVITRTPHEMAEKYKEEFNEGDRHELIFGNNIWQMLDLAEYISNDLKAGNISVPYLNKDKCDCFIIGGKQIYLELLPYVDKVFWSKLKKEYECDTWFSHDYDMLTLRDGTTQSTLTLKNKMKAFSTYEKKEFESFTLFKLKVFEFSLGNSLGGFSLTPKKTELIYNQ